MSLSRKENVVVTTMIEVDLPRSENLASFPPRTIEDDLALAKMKKAVIERVKDGAIRDVRIVKIKEEK